VLEQQLGNPLLIASILLWSLPWKGLALWRAAQRKHKIWFIIILVINTFGLLEIIYYFFLSKRDWNLKMFTRKKS